MMDKKICGYLRNDSKTAKIKELCGELSISFRKLGFGDLNKSLGELFCYATKEDKNFKKAPALMNMQEILIFSGFTNEELDDFLDRYNKKGIEPVMLKGIMTPTNINWSLYRLYGEYERERNEIEK